MYQSNATECKLFSKIYDSCGLPADVTRTRAVLFLQVSRQPHKVKEIWPSILVVVSTPQGHELAHPLTPHPSSSQHFIPVETQM